MARDIARASLPASLPASPPASSRVVLPYEQPAEVVQAKASFGVHHGACSPRPHEPLQRHRCIESLVAMSKVDLQQDFMLVVKSAVAGAQRMVACKKRQWDHKPGSLG